VILKGFAKPNSNPDAESRDSFPTT
jgi:hypothetical protein